MFSAFTRLSLVTRIIIAIILGILVAILFPNAAPYLSLLGDLFIKALKSVAPILVFVLVLSSIANFKVGSNNAYIKPIMLMYALGMLLAAFSAVVSSVLFPSTLFLDAPAQGALTPPGSLAEILKNLLLSFIANPVTAISEANFIGILAWAVALGVAFRHSSDQTKAFLSDAAEAVNKVYLSKLRSTLGGITRYHVICCFSGQPNYGCIYNTCKSISFGFSMLT